MARIVPETRQTVVTEGTQPACTVELRRHHERDAPDSAGHAKPSAKSVEALADDNPATDSAVTS